MQTDTNMTNNTKPEGKEQYTFSYWFMRDNHTFVKPTGETVEEIANSLIDIAKDNPYGMVCPVTVLHGETEVKRVGLHCHVDAHGRVNLDKWITEVQSEIDQFSPSDHTAPQGEEEQKKLWTEAIDLIEVFADDVSKIHNDAIHVVANQFTIQKKQPLTKLSDK